MDAAVQALLDEGEDLQAAGDRAGAGARYADAVRRLRASGAGADLATALLHLVHLPGLATDEVLAHLAEAARIHEVLGDPKRAVEVLTAAAVALNMQAHALRCAEILAEPEAESESADETTGQATATTGDASGAPSGSQARHAAATQALEMAAALCERTGTADARADAHFELAQHLLMNLDDRDDHAAAIAHFAAAETAFREQGRRTALADCLFFHGAALLEFDRNREAAPRLAEAEALYDEIGLPHARAKALMLLVEALAPVNAATPLDPAAARRHAGTGRALTRGLGDAFLESRFETALARLGG